MITAVASGMGSRAQIRSSVNPVEQVGGPGCRVRLLVSRLQDDPATAIVTDGSKPPRD